VEGLKKVIAQLINKDHHPKRYCHLTQIYFYVQIPSMLSPNTKLLLYIAFLSSISLSSLHALVTRVSDAVTQNRFASGFPSAPVDNVSGTFLLNDYDLSGIGWDTNDTRKGFVMISPIHFLAATHFAPNSSNSITFQNQSGNLVNIGVASVQAMNNDSGSASDLTLGTLNRAITTGDELNFFAVANLATESLYVGREIFVYGRTPKVGKGTIASFQDFGSDPVTAGSGLNPSRTYQFAYSTLGGSNDDAYFEVGDSGSPSFTFIDGQLAVTGIHSALASATGTFINYDTFVPDYVDELNTAMDSSGFQVTSVPEPSVYSIVLVFTVLGGAVYRRRN